MRSAEEAGRLEHGVLAWTRWMEELAHRFFPRGKSDRKEEPSPEGEVDLLDGLPPGFFVFHDFHSGHGTINHILVGSKGLFILKLETHHGTVAIFGDQIFRNGRSVDRDLIHQIQDEAWALQQLLARKGIASLRPQPIILFVNAVVGVHGTIKGVEVLQKNALPAYMKRRKDVISPRDAEGIFEFLKIGQAGSPI